MTKHGRVAAFLAAALLTSGSYVATAGADAISDQKRKVERINDQLDALADRIGRLGEDHAAAQDRLEVLEVGIAAAEADIAAQTVVLGQVQAHLTAVALDRYTSGGAGLTPLLSTPRAFTDEMQRTGLAHAVIEQGSGTSDDLRALLNDLDDKSKRLAAKQKEQAALLESLAAKQRDAEELTAQYRAQEAAAKAELGDLIEEDRQRRAAIAIAEAQAAQRRRQMEAEAAAARAAAQAAADAAAAAAARSAASTPRGGGATVPASGGAEAKSEASDSSATQAPASAPSAPSSAAQRAVAAAMSQLGVPYRFAAESPGRAFDCSGLTKWAWGQAGVYLPHQSASQYASTRHISRSQIQPGDLLFYRSPIGHVAMYIGNGQLIHAPFAGEVVKIANVNWNTVVGVSRPG